MRSRSIRSQNRCRMSASKFVRLQRALGYRCDSPDQLRRGWMNFLYGPEEYGTRYGGEVPEAKRICSAILARSRTRQPPSQLTPITIGAVGSSGFASRGTGTRRFQSRTAANGPVVRYFAKFSIKTCDPGHVNVDPTDTGYGLSPCSNWTEQYDPKINVNYYFNMQTGESTWIKPAELM